MNPVICPHCDLAVPEDDITSGWCELCGKKLPEYVLRAAGRKPNSSISHSPAHRQIWPIDPEKVNRVVFGGRPLASRTSRLAAYFVDGIAGLVASSPALVLLYVAVQAHSEELLYLGLGLYVVVATCLTGVQLYLVSTRGQSVGKILLRIRIVRFQDEGNPGFGGAVMTRMIIPLLIGQIPCLGSFFFIANFLWIFSAERRCLHDLIADTKVVRA